MRRTLNKFIFVFFLLQIASGCRAAIERQRENLPSKPFDRQAWINRGEGEFDRSEEAAMMARDLVNKNSLIGESRSQITELLGKSEDENPRLNANYKSPPEISYELKAIYGNQPLEIGIEPIAVERLKIKFNQENKVEKAEIYLYKTRFW